jgi:hypothetical protein
VPPHPSQKPVGHEIGVGAGALVWVELAEAGPQFGRSAMVASSRRSAFNSGVALKLGALLSDSASEFLSNSPNSFGAV